MRRRIASNAADVSIRRPRDAKPVATTATAKPAIAESKTSFAPRNTEEKRYADRFIARYGRHPSLPDLMAFRQTEKSRLDMLSQIYRDYLAKRLKQALTIEQSLIDPGLQVGTALGEQLLVGSDYMAVELEKLAHLELDTTIERSGAEATIEELALLIARCLKWGYVCDKVLPAWLRPT